MLTKSASRAKTDTNLEDLVCSRRGALGILTIAGLTLFGCDNRNNSKQQTDDPKAQRLGEANKFLLDLFPPEANEVTRFQNHGWTREEATQLSSAMSCLRKAILLPGDPREARLKEIPWIPLDQSSNSGNVAAYDPTKDRLEIVRVQAKSLVRLCIAIPHEGVHACAHREPPKDFEHEQLREITAYSQQLKDVDHLIDFVHKAAGDSKAKSSCEQLLVSDKLQVQVLLSTYQVRADFCKVSKLIDQLLASNVVTDSKSRAALDSLNISVISILKQDPSFEINCSQALVLLSTLRSQFASSLRLRSSDNSRDTTNEVFGTWENNVQSLSEAQRAAALESPP